MRYLKILLTALLVSGTAAATNGQIIHLRIESTAGFYGEYVTTPYHNFDEPLTVDVYYNPGLTEVANPWGEGAYYTPTDPNNNFFRVRTAGVDVRGQLDSILVTDYGMWFRSTDSPHAYDAFNLLLAWVSPPSSYALPSITFPEVDPHTYQEGADPLFFGGPKVFGNSGPEAQYNWGTLYRTSGLTLETEVVPRMSISPVPEPATYGWAAAVVLVGVVCWRRRRIVSAEGGRRPVS